MADIKKIMSLSGDTAIPLSFIGMIFAAAYWLNSLTARIEAAETQITDQSKFEDFSRQHLEDQSRALGEIKAQIAGIDARIEMMLRVRKKPE